VILITSTLIFIGNFLDSRRLAGLEFSQ